MHFVIRETAETTKLRVVYDASAKANEKAPSLNDCLNPGLALKNKLMHQRSYQITRLVLGQGWRHTVSLLPQGLSPTYQERDPKQAC